MGIFEYAHNHEGVVWMSQNTNHLVSHPSITQALEEAISQRKYCGYPLQTGYPPLREAILEDLPTPGYDLHITCGGTEGLYVLMRCLLPKGTEMVTTDPSYMIIHNFAHLTGAVTTDLDVYKGNYRYDIEKVKEAINPRTKVLLLIDPLNPLGTTYPKEEVRALSELAVDHDLWIIDDITYRDYAPDHVLTSDFAPEHSIIATSVSKNCGLAGMRVGGILGPPEFMKQTWKWVVSDLSINILGMVAGAAALKCKAQWLPEVRQTALLNQKLIKECVDNIEGAYLPVYPSWANMFVIDIAGTGLTPRSVQDKLLYEHGVFTRGGEYVSATSGHRYLRVSFTVPTEGIKRFTAALPVVIEQLIREQTG